MKDPVDLQMAADWKEYMKSPFPGWNPQPPPAPSLARVRKRKRIVNWSCRQDTGDSCSVLTFNEGRIMVHSGYYWFTNHRWNYESWLIVYIIYIRRPRPSPWPGWRLGPPLVWTLAFPTPVLHRSNRAGHFQISHASLHFPSHASLQRRTFMTFRLGCPPKASKRLLNGYFLQPG